MDEFPVFLRGEIDIASTADVINQLRRAAGRRDGEVVADCCDITFIDVVGVEALLRVQRELVDRGRDLRLVHPSPMLTLILQLLDLTELLRPIAA